MPQSTPLSDALLALVRHGEGGVRIFPSTLEDVLVSPASDPFVFPIRTRAVTAVADAGVSLMDIAAKCAPFWGEDVSSGFVGDLAKSIVARSAPLGRVQPLPPAPGPYTLVEWYAGARVLLPLDYSQDRTTLILPSKAALSLLAADMAGLPSLLNQKSTPRPPLISPALTAGDLFLVASRNAADGNALAQRVLEGSPANAVDVVLDFFELADNALLVYLAMRPDGYALLQRLEKVLSRAPSGDPPPTDAVGKSPEARAKHARGMAALAETFAVENRPEVWDKRYVTKRTRIGLSYEAYKTIIAGLRKDGPVPPGFTKKPPAPLAAASAWGGNPRQPVAIDRAQLRAILNPSGDPALDAKLDQHRGHLNRAFEVMQIDTVEAQAAYLAHAGGETGGFDKLVEVGQDASEWAPFIGRGPVQVTWEYNYIQTLVYLEVQAERLHHAAKIARADGSRDEAERLEDDAAYLKAAVLDIKGDITVPGRPDRAFLFSAAYMHMTGGVKSSAALKGRNPSFAGNGAEDGWVSGQETSWATQRDAVAKKKEPTKKFDDLISRAVVKKATYNLAKEKLGPKP